MDLLDFPLYDLRTSAGIGTATNNTGIVDMLDKLIEHTKSVKASSKDKATHQRRITSFIRAKDAIKDYDKQITSGYQAQRDIDGVGKGIATRIDEFLKTGTLVELVSTISPINKLILELSSVTGIGEVKAQSLIKDYDVKSVDDLIEKYKAGIISVKKNQLTNHIAIGLEYYYDLNQRMTWDEADMIAQFIISAISRIDKNIIVNVCGSYRRKCATCGDIDVLISHVDNTISLPDIVTALEDAKFLVGHLTTKGKTKYMGVCKMSDRGRRIDIRCVDYNSLGAALLYFTGSGKFNEIMRHHANLRGYTLNEYGLYTRINGVKGETPIPAVSEKDIFTKLGFVYLSPEEREFK